MRFHLDPCYHMRKQQEIQVSPKPCRQTCILWTLLFATFMLVVVYNRRQISFISIPTICAAICCCCVFIFFHIACGSPLYTLRFSNICLQGDVSVPNRWPSFLHTHITILQTLKGPSTYITFLRTLWNSSSFLYEISVQQRFEWLWKMSIMELVNL